MTEQERLELQLEAVDELIAGFQSLLDELFHEQNFTPKEQMRQQMQTQVTTVALNWLLDEQAYITNLARGG